MTKVYILVVDTPLQGTILETQSRKEDIFARTVNLSCNEFVRRIFSVDELGRVVHYEIVFEGKFKLRELPDREPRKSRKMS